MAKQLVANLPAGHAMLDASQVLTVNSLMAQETIILVKNQERNLWTVDIIRARMRNPKSPFFDDEDPIEGTT